MRHDLNIDLVFPIKDHVSAWLMRLKAEALYEGRDHRYRGNEHRSRTRCCSPRQGFETSSL